MTSKKFNCPICLDLKPHKSNANLRCNHQICLPCVKQLRVSKCPICREPLLSLKLKLKDLSIIQKRFEKDNEEKTCGTSFINVIQNNECHVEEDDDHVLCLIRLH